MLSSPRLKPGADRHHRIHRSVNWRLAVGTAAIVLMAGAASFGWYKSRTRITVTTLLDRAEQLAAEEEWDLASGYLKRAVTLRPSDIDARLRMAACYVRAADTPPKIERAIDVLRGTLAVVPNDIQVQVDLARLLYEAGEYEEALRYARGEFVDELEERLTQPEMNSTKASEQFHTAQRVWALAQFARVDEDARPIGTLSPIAEDPRQLRATAYEAVEVPLNFDRDDSGGRTVHPSDLVPVFSKALVANPKDVQLAGAAADLYSRHAEVFQTDEFDPLGRAYAIFDNLIESNAENPDAWIARYRFRSSVEEDSAAPLEDLDRALEIAPDSVEALFFRGVAHLRSGKEADLELALRDLDRAIEAAPFFERAYLALSELYEIRDGPNRALSFLGEANATELRNASVPLALRCVELQLSAQQLKEAQESLKAASQLAAEHSPSWNDKARAEINARLKLLEGALELSNRHPAAAIQHLNFVTISLDPWTTREVWARDLDRRARVLLADAWTRQNAHARAAEQWRVIAEQNEEARNGLFYAGESLRMAGLFGEAKDAYEDFLQVAVQAPQAEQARIALLESQFRLQLLQPADDRDWKEFEASLHATVEALPGRWEPKLLEVEYRLATVDLSDEQNVDEATRLIENAVAAHRDDPSCWEAAAKAYARLGDSEAGKSAIEAYQRSGGSPATAAMLRAEGLDREGRHGEADAELESVLVNASDHDRLLIQRHRIEKALSDGNVDLATSIAEDLGATHRWDAAAVAAAFQVALVADDFKQCRELEERLEALGDPNSLDLRLLRAQRLLGELSEIRAHSTTPGDNEARAVARLDSQLAPLLDDLRAAQPQSKDVLVLLARHAELTGNRDKAIRYYDSAVQLGERRLWVVEHLCHLLKDAGRIVDAEKILRLVPSDANPAPTSLDGLAISLAVQRQDLDEAIREATEAAHRNPDDITRALWLANLVLLNEEKNGTQGNRAEEEFVGITHRFPNDMRAWHGLFSFYIKSHRENEARTVLPTLLANIETDDAAAAFITGQCQEQLGDWADARASYQRAVDAEPRNVDYLKRLARLLLTTDVAAARNLYEEITHKEPGDLESRRQYAVLLASTGEEDDWNKAIELLGGEYAASSADERLRAILLTRRGRTRADRKENCEEAMRILTGIIREADGPIEDVDRILLASVCTQMSVLDKRPTLLETARQELRPLVEREDAPPQYLAMYLEFLIANPAEEAYTLDDSGQLEFLRRIRDAFLADANKHLMVLENKTRNPEGLVPLSVLRYRLQVMELKGGSHEQLEDELRNYAKLAQRVAESDSERLAVYAGMGNLATSLALHNAAEHWYREVANLTEAGNLMVAASLAAQGQLNEASQHCLAAIGDENKQQVARLLAQIFASTAHSDDQYHNVKAVIESAVRDHHGDRDLLMTVAVMHTQRGDYDAAVRLLRQVLEIAPDDALALNNLATLLAESPSTLEEARRYIEQAIAIEGRKAALLDTQGTVHLLAGDTDRAIGCLEEATAGIVRDPRTYLHLVAAYDAAGRKGDVQRYLRKIEGVEATILTTAERQMLQGLKQNYAKAFVSLQQH